MMAWKFGARRAFVALAAAALLAGGAAVMAQFSSKMFKLTDANLEESLKTAIAEEEKRGIKDNQFYLLEITDLGRVYAEQGKVAEAARQFDMASECAGKFNIPETVSAIALLSAGRFFYGQKDFAKSEKLASQTVDLCNGFLKATADDARGVKGLPTALDEGLGLKAASLLQQNKDAQAQAVYANEAAFVKAKASAYVKVNFLDQCQKSVKFLAFTDAKAKADFLTNFDNAAKMILKATCMVPPNPPGYDYCSTTHAGRTARPEL